MSVPLESKVFPITTAVNGDGHLEIGGCDVTSLAREFGTPLYVFDEATLRNQAEGFLKRSAPATTTAASSMPASVHQRAARALHRGARPGVRRRVGGEIAVLRAAGVDLSTVDFHGNNKTPGRDQAGRRVGGRPLRHRQLPRTAPAGRGRRSSRTHAARPHPGLAFHRPPHAPPHHHRRAGQQVRLPHRDGRRRGGGATGDGRASPGPAGHSLHLGSPIFELEPYTEAIERVVRFSARMGEYGMELRRLQPPAAASPSPTRRTTPRQR